MRSLFLLCSLSAVLLGAARTARAGFTTTVTTPYPGVTHTTYVDASVPLKLHVVTADITSQELYLSATLSADRGQTVSDWANCKRGTSGCATSDIAINGDLFAPSGFVPSGLAIGGAKAWPDASRPNAVEGWFGFGRPMDLNAVQLSPPGNPQTPATTLAVEGVVGGRALLVQSGMAMTSYDAADPTEPFRAAPRTALGLDGAAHTLYLVVVDGDQAQSAGMTAYELAAFLSGIGVSDALELDGGGSSELFVRKEGGVVSSPSNGVERPVANHLGLRFGAQVHFSVVGFVCPNNFCGAAQAITNATVSVDGQTAYWPPANNHTLYQADNITPHYVCAHASAPGYRSGTQCREITVQDVQSMGNIQYLTIVLNPGSDPPPDMTPPPDMAMRMKPPPVLDLALPPSSSDGGAHNGAHSGCDAAPAGASVATGIGFAVVLFLGAARIFRRRRDA